MKLFTCQNCGQILFFENTRCERCHLALGYISELGMVSALKDGEDEFEALAALGTTWRRCRNAEHDACNWMIPAETDYAYCVACRPNRTIPDLSDAENLRRWRRMESAKHRLFYTLMRLGLPVVPYQEDRETGLAFDFLADTDPNFHVMTGHEDGLITLAIREADDSERERLRDKMGESYRTLLGHFRHEIGHYYWDRMVAWQGGLPQFRDVFGDERRDYQQALRQHYADGAAADWQSNYISAYASSHPWEDFAETWAHYLHIVDALETASVFGIGIHPHIDPAALKQARLDIDIAVDPYHVDAIEPLIDAWLPLVAAANSLNRSMGQPDFYPFTLSQPVIAKLAFIQRLIYAHRPS
jgi:hypothetical protein